MRIAVIGAGLAGVSTAYELARDGHEVTVYDRRGGIAAEGGFAPASVATPGLWLAHAAVGALPGLEPLEGGTATLPWRWRRWRTSRRGQADARLQLMNDLARLGQSRREAAGATHQLAFEQHRGVLALLRRPRHAQRAQDLLQQYAALELPVRWVEPSQVRAVEPALSPDLPLQGALHWPQGTTANGRQYSQALKAAAQACGARFLLQWEVVALTAVRGPGVELRLARCHEFAETVLAPLGGGATTVPDDPAPSFDAVVICSAEAARRLLGPCGAGPKGMTLAVHSVTAPLCDPNEAGEVYAPQGAVVDPASRVVISRMGERIRAAGRSRLGEPPHRPDPATLTPLYQSLEACFPGVARTAKARAWVGGQTTTADGLPVVGAAATAGVWLHWGHGANAWSWAPAAACILADQIGGRSAAFDTALLAPTRLG